MTRHENLLKAAEGTDGHLVQLDGLRAFAAISVIVQHFTNVESYTRFPAGIAGVWLFFVLSGFLITGILLRVKDRTSGDKVSTRFAWRAFYYRRMLRIFPLYFGVLISVYLLDLPGVRAHIGWYIGQVANLANALPGRAAPPLFHFWSLSVEEQFYFVWPTIILLAPRKWIIAASVAMVVLAPISRLAMITATGKWDFAQSLPPSCLDGMGMGALLALVRHGGGFSDRQRSWFRNLALAFGILIFAADLGSHFYKVGYRIPFAIRYSGYALLSYWLIDRAADGFTGPIRRILEARPMIYLGRISYGIYVIHLIVPYLFAWARENLGLDLGYPADPGLMQFLYVTATSIVLATISWYAMEKPINGLKHHFPYIRKTTPAVGVEPALSTATEMIPDPLTPTTQAAASEPAR